MTEPDLLQTLLSQLGPAAFVLILALLGLKRLAHYDEELRHIKDKVDDPKNLSWTRPKAGSGGWLARSDDAAGPSPARRSDKARHPPEPESGRVAESPYG